MRRKTNYLLPLVTILFSLSVLIGVSRAAEVKVLTLYWRGPTEVIQGFRDGLKDLGVSAQFTEFDAQRNKKTLNDYVAGITESQFDLIYTFGTTVTTTIAKQIKKTPILAKIGNPVESGIIKSWENSGNNIIAVSQIVDYPEQINFINSLGNFKKIGSIQNPKEKNSVVDNRELARYFKENGQDFITVDAGSVAELPGAVDALLKRQVDFVYLSSSLVTENTEKIVPVLNSHKIPTYARSESIIMRDNGALCGVVSSYYEVGREMASRAKMILDGKKPSEVPSYRMPLARQRILFNKKTAEQLDIVIPYNLLRRAEVYPQQ